MINILITGCAGFIGRSLINRIQNTNLKKNYYIYGIDNLSSSRIEQVPKKIRFIKGNCEDDRILKKLINKKIKYILHFAGQSSNEKSFYNPVKDFNDNVYSTLKLLEFYTKNKCKHFIYASSMSVYGATPNKPIAENFYCNPISFYGNSKLTSEKYIKLYKQKNVNYTILRLFNVYGPGQLLNSFDQGMIRIYLNQIYNKKKVVVKGSKNRFRDFVYIDDVIDSIVKILGNKNSYGRIFNIGTNKKTYVKNLLKILKNKTKINFPIKYEKGTPGDQFGIYSNNQSVKKLISLKFDYNLDRGLENYIDYINKNI